MRVVLGDVNFERLRDPLNFLSLMELNRQYLIKFLIENVFSYFWEGVNFSFFSSSLFEVRIRPSFDYSFTDGLEMMCPSSWPLNFDDFPFFRPSIAHLGPQLQRFENRSIFVGISERERERDIGSEGGRGSPTWEKFPHFPGFFFGNVPKNVWTSVWGLMCSDGGG